jgi:hypothetical protein
VGPAAVADLADDGVDPPLECIVAVAGCVEERVPQPRPED